MNWQRIADYVNAHFLDILAWIGVGFCTLMVITVIDYYRREAKEHRK